MRGVRQAPGIQNDTRYTQVSVQRCRKVFTETTSMLHVHEMIVKVWVWPITRRFSWRDWPPH